MHIIFLLIPFLMIRFGLLWYFDKEAIGRAAHFAPMEPRERPAYWTYQITTLAIFLISIFLPAKAGSLIFYLGGVLYLLGLALCVLSMRDFSRPSPEGFCRKGVYRISRNPMYVAYFLCFLGCAILARSLFLLLIVFLFQISAHWIIRAEERWCIAQFGEEYLQYMHAVRRYL